MFNHRYDLDFDARSNNVDEAIEETITQYIGFIQIIIGGYSILYEKLQFNFASSAKYIQ